LFPKPDIAIEEEDDAGQSQRWQKSRFRGRVEAKTRNPNPREDFAKKNDEIERGSVYSRLERDMDKKMISYETNVERVKSMNI